MPTQRAFVVVVAAAVVVVVGLQFDSIAAV